MKKILVPLDGSSLAEAVIPQIHRLAKHGETELILLHVFHMPPVDANYLAVIARLRDDSRRYLKSVEEKLARDGMHVRSLDLEGPPAPTILLTAEQEGVALIAMSTHGRGGIGRFVMGSVAEKVLRSSPIPVLLLRSFEAAAGVMPYSPPERPFRNVLVPYDGSERSLEVSAVITSFFSALDARVTLLHVVDPMWNDVKWAIPAVPLKEAADRFIAACIPTVTEIRKGDPAAEILDAARDLKCDLIAMTTHGRSGPNRWVLGSVTEKVVRHSDQPLLIVRSR